MKTKAITGLSIQIQDDGRITLRAPDREAEGHLWAIEEREISIVALRAVGEALGRDAVEGIDGALRAVLDCADREALRLAELIDQAEVARRRATRLRRAIEPRPIAAEIDP